MTRRTTYRGPTYRTTSGGWNLKALFGDLQKAWRLMQDPTVPSLLKIGLPLLALIYWFSPIDLLPGLPFDDIAVLLLLARFFVNLFPGSGEQAPKSETKSYSRESNDDDNTIETTWRVIDEPSSKPER